MNPGDENPGDETVESVELVDLVDADDRVIGCAPRRDVRARNLLHRGVGVLCLNGDGLVYVHRRTATKDVFPGLYDMFVGGVVGRGEDYDSAARREIAEELGIVGPEPRYLFHHFYLGRHNCSRVAVYDVEWDGEVRHQESEVAWGAWVTMETLLARLNEWEFVPDGLEIFHRYLEYRRSRGGGETGRRGDGDRWRARS